MSLSGSVFQRRIKSAIVPPSDCRRWDGFALPRTVFVIVIALIASTALMLAVPNDAAAQTDSAKVKTLVRLDSRAEGDRILITNIKDPSKAKVTVHLDEAKNTDPSMLGSTSIENGNLIFTPRFSLQPGTRFRVMVQSDPALKPEAFFVDTPKRNEQASKVVAVYPSSDTLPENTLRFYVQFSAPMRKGNIYRYLSIREVGGKVVELPFLEIEQEFWSRDSKRLTLLLDPGRVKRGLKPREEMGPILVEGKTYELVVDGDWPNSNGRKLGQDFIKRFQVTAADHLQPDPSKWKVTAPAAGTTEPLVVEFLDSIDHSMLSRSIRVLDSAGKEITGEIEIGGRETRWNFKPDLPWSSGVQKLNVNATLEDNAGNSIGRPFDVDLIKKAKSGKSPSAIELEFQVK